MSDAQTTAPRTASYQAAPGEVGSVLLLYSGGLDTSVMLRWIQESYDAEIVTLTVNLGQPEENWEVITQKARDLGALDAIVVDARESGCDTIAHGCTGKGNDQVRIEATIATLDPELGVIAPVREWEMGREQEIAYAREHGIPVAGGTEAPPYSIDDNLWGRSSEGGSIEDLERPPEDDVFRLVARPEDAPDEPETVTIRFERGTPAAIDGERLGLVELLDRAAELGRRNGVGIVDHVEDRIAGLKVRDLYEVPAAAIVLTAHRE